MLYSPEDESAMGEDDIQDADSDPVEKTEFTLLKFKLGDKFLVAATLRAETVFGQTNLWINPKIKYVEAEVEGETWILSKEAFEKLKYQKKNIGNSKPFKGKLIGEMVEAPMIKRKLIILPSAFVDPDVGTGIVTSVPSDSAYDYVALRELQDNKGLEKRYGFSFEQIEEIEEIEIIPIIKSEKYGDKSAVNLVEKEGIISQDDKRLDKLTQEIYKDGFHTGILLETCGKYSGMKVREAKERMRHDMISRNEADIMFDTSRKAYSRGGGRIVVAVLDGQWFLDFNSPGWKEKAKECLTCMEILPEQMRRQFEDTFAWLDKRPCARRRGLGTRFPFDKDWVVESLSDSTIYMTLYTIAHLIEKYKIKRENMNEEFFDYIYLGKGDVGKVSKKTGIGIKALNEIRESFEYWMPVDLRHTFSLHLSNHLSFMIFAHAALFDKGLWPHKISFHGLVVSEGEKMSKSKGNVITLLDIKKKIGADVFRFYMTHSTNVNGTFDWREQEAQSYKSNAGKLYLSISESIKKSKKGKVPDYYLHKFNMIKKMADEKINQMKYREFNSLVVFDMMNLVNKAKMSMDSKTLGAFYGNITEDWIKLISPIMPHIAEELWSKLKKRRFVSSDKWPGFDESKIDDKFDKEDAMLDKLVNDIKQIKTITGKEKPKVYIYPIPPEMKIYQDNIEMIKNSAGLNEVIVFAINDKNKHDPEGKSGKAKPGKPGIYVE